MPPKITVTYRREMAPGIVSLGLVVEPARRRRKKRPEIEIDMKFARGIAKRLATQAKLIPGFANPK
jgi:hypothetical protein